MSGPLEKTVNNIVKKFNQSQTEYRVIPIYKGNYPDTLTATVAAFRAGEQPDIVQIFEVGTATMIYPKGIIVPVYQLMQENHIKFNPDDILPAIRYYYSDAEGQLLSMPFNSSTPVLFYNKAMFQKAGLNPNEPPTTWPQLEKAAKKILAAGFSCGFTTGWPSWTQIENYSAWHNVPLAMDNNGFTGVDAKLLYDNPVVTKQFNALKQWQANGIFQYGGRQDDAMSLFTSQRCAMIIESSAWFASLKDNLSFSVGTGPIPYWPDVEGAPQNSIIGGASLWALAGHDKNIDRGIAIFFAFLAKPSIQAQWSQATGYLPITKQAFQLNKQQGYYQTYPGNKVAIDELNHKPPTNNSKGLRIGNYTQLRQINDAAIEAAISGQRSVKQALADAVQQGNSIINSFAKNVTIK